MLPGLGGGRVAKIPIKTTLNVTNLSCWLIGADSSLYSSRLVWGHSCMRSHVYLDLLEYKHNFSKLILRFDANPNHNINP